MAGRVQTVTHPFLGSGTAQTCASRRYSRRDVLRAGGSLALATALAGGLTLVSSVKPRLGVAAPLKLNDDTLVSGRDAALAVLRHLLARQDGYMVHHAGDRYRNPWIRDSFAWGNVPIYGYPELDPYAGSELDFWLAHQQASGQWVTDPQSGYWDETAMLIAAVLDAYRVTGDRGLVVNNLRRLESGWLWLYGFRREDSAAPYLVWAGLDRSSGRPPVATDWADQIARMNWATSLNLLWYHATRSLAVMEGIAGRPEQASFFREYADSIRQNINRTLWRVGPVQSLRADPTPPFGHYVGWAPGADYFEVDTNLLAIMYGVADRAQAESILTFVDANRGYLLGSEWGPPAAKVVYGDYAREDWATIQNSTSPGAYHMAYWINVGALAALAYHVGGRAEPVRSILMAMANTLTAEHGGTGVREWYAQDGTAHGSEQYGWSARGYLIALYRAYLGIDADWSDPFARNLRVSPMFGGVSGELFHLGRRIVVTVHGPEIGPYRYAEVDGTRVESAIIPEALLRDGATVNLFLE